MELRFCTDRTIPIRIVSGEQAFEDPCKRSAWYFEAFCQDLFLALITTSPTQNVDDILNRGMFFEFVAKLSLEDQLVSVPSSDAFLLQEAFLL